MSRRIRVEVNALEQIVHVDHALDRKSKIQLQKQQIHHFRNQLLSEQLQVTIQHEQLTTTEYGKPYLINFPEFYFNHSHSQKNYALALSHSVKDLGIDVEDLDRKVRFEALAQHAFHPKELETWNSLEQQKEYWFKVWTTKEAVLKAAGLGIRINLNEFDTQVHSDQNGGMCSHPQIGKFAYQNFQLAHIMLTVAWRSEQSCKGFNLPEIQIHQH